MAGPYSTLSDADLLAKLAKYEDAFDTVNMGGGLAVIAGEGRRKEFTKANPGSLNTTLAELRYERDIRPSLNPAGASGGSLALEIGRDHGC